MEKVWLKQYPEKVKHTIDMDQYANLTEILDDTVRKHGDKPAVTNLGITLSYNELAQKVNDFASYLQNDLGLSKGDKLALMMPNLLQYPIALFGALKAGLAVVNVNPLYTPRELAHQLTDSGAKSIVILANFADTLEESLDKVQLDNIIVTQVGDVCPQPKRFIVNFVVKYFKKMVPKANLPKTTSFVDALARGEKQKFKTVEIGHADTAFLQYTCGQRQPSQGFFKCAVLGTFVAA